jgi:hypothetical protein
VSYLWIAGAVLDFAALVLLMVNQRRGKDQVLPVLVAAIGTFVLVAGVLLAVDTGAAKHEAIKTGGLAGGAVVALYALWLNDRRRRTDEQRQAIEVKRQKLEDARAEHDRSRVADERFARSVEMLGHDTDQVRVGALHALAGLAKSRPEYTQTVLDIICSYLRRPFDRDGEVGPRDREQQVRLTAQRLIRDLLPEVQTQGAPRFNVDLTKADLEYFDLSHRQLGNVYLRAAQFHVSNSLHHAVVHGSIYLTGSTNHGRLHVHDIDFRGKASFREVTSTGSVNFENTVFHGPAKFTDSTFEADVSFKGCTFHEPIELSRTRFTGGLDLTLAKPMVARTHAMTVALDKENQLPQGWVVDPREGEIGLVRS